MSIPSIDGSSNLPGPSKAPSPPTCALCVSQPSKYTCPRCQIKTCSLLCSRAHKTATGCSGERDRTAFVPMNQYGYGALVNDYVFLEEVGRKVEHWEREIVREKIAVRNQSGAVVHGSNMRGSRGRGIGRGKNMTFGRGKDRRSFLAMQLSFRDIDMDVLPSGMDRAGQNSSCWDSKTKRALLTVEFLFRPPPDPITLRQTRPKSVITNRNDWDQTIRQIVQRSVTYSQSTIKLLNWLSLEDEDETIPTSVLCLMKRPRTHDDSDSVDMYSTRPSYYKLDWNTELSKALRHKHFVEFPTILLIDENSFDGVLVDDQGAVEVLRERRPKRRKLDNAEAKKTIAGLVGGYGSDEEEELNVLDTLADYPESEGDNEDTSEPEDDGLLDEASEEQVADFQDVLDIEQSLDNFVAVALDNDEDVLDWGNDEIAEDEAKLASLSAAVQQRYSS